MRLVVQTFRIIVLPTDSAMGDVPKYPSNVTVRVPADQVYHLSAYGVAERVFIAPRGWAGHGATSMDGGAIATLGPSARSSMPSGSIEYRLEGGCYGCAVFEAARYFLWLRAHWDDAAWGQIPAARPLLRKVYLSPRLIAYQAPDTREGLEVNGLVYTTVAGKPGPGYLFKRLEVTLPHSQRALATTILDNFGFPR